MRLRWLLPIGHTLVNAVLVSALFFSAPENRRTGTGSLFLLYGQEGPVSFKLRGEVDFTAAPPAFQLLAIGNLPAHMVASIWYPYSHTFLEMRTYVAIHLPVSVVVWFLLGLYFERAPHPHVLGRRFLTLRAASLLLLSWWFRNLPGVFVLIWLGFFCLLGYRGLREIWVRLSPAGV